MAKENVRHFDFSGDFKRTVSEGYYVDKSLFLKEVIDDHDQVSLITRPSGFGKSLNMDMMKTFFEKTDEDNSVYFKNLKIWQCGEKYTSQQGKYPVIYMNFKDVKGDSWEEAYERMKEEIIREYARHARVFKNMKEWDHETLERMMGGNGRKYDYEDSIAFLSRLIHRYYKIKPIVIIDEYEFPVQYGYDHGYYEEINDFLWGFLLEGFNCNHDYDFGILSGVVRFSNDNLFRGFSNLILCSILDCNYSEYFGFTEDEVKGILKDFGHPEKLDEVSEWYGGYRCGEIGMFNPGSVAKYVENGFEPASYWPTTAFLEDMLAPLKNASIYSKEFLEALASGERANGEVCLNVRYKNLREDEYSCCCATLLWAYGFVTVCVPTDEECEGLRFWDDHVLAVPNRDVGAVFCDEVRKFLAEG